jgi:hypothetical protein
LIIFFFTNLLFLAIALEDSGLICIYFYSFLYIKFLRFSGIASAHSGLMGLPARPPCLVPGVDPGKYRMRLFDGQLPDRAISAAVHFFDITRAPRDCYQIGVEPQCVFHFQKPPQI